MKKLTLSLCLLFLPATLIAEKLKVDPADYTVSVHVIGSQGGSTSEYQHVVAMIDGHQMVLQALYLGRGVLALGDYKAKQVNSPHAPKALDGHDLYLAYEFLFSDGTTRYWEVIGLGAPDLLVPAGAPNR